MTEKQKKFMEEIAGYVQEIAPQFGIEVVSPIVAQAILESGWGTSNKAKYHNYFGLKYKKNRVSCNSGYFTDGSSEQLKDGTYIPITTDWFAFKNMEDGVRGYFEFINCDNYKSLKGVTDPFKYIELIKKAGYATSQSYVQNLTNVIKNYNLTKYDKEEKTMATKKFKVHLDPGHYGSKYNQSLVNKSYYESNMTWTLTNYLKDELEKRGVEVTLSRSKKEDNPSLYNRGYGSKGCNLFLSIHSNACNKESIDYPAIIRGYDKKEADEFAKKFGQLIKDLMKTQNNYNIMTKKSDAGGEWYGVLNGADKAGLTYYYIIEHSFHTNKKAVNWLMKDSNLKLLAQKEADLICEYFKVEVKKEEKKYYRIRKSWKDANSQIGAYTVLANAKKDCKPGYAVYDWNGKAVYTVPVKKTNEQIAREVIAGKWGNGAARKLKLTAAGYNYSEIQKLVNRLLK